MRVVLAEDNVLLRQGLAQLLQTKGVEVTSEVDNADDLLRAVDEDKPDVVVTDIRMPPSNTTEGLRAAEEIKKRHPEVGVLVLSQYVEAREAVRLLVAAPEGMGYLLKDRVSDIGELVAAIERVGEGGSIVDPEVFESLTTHGKSAALVSRLSEREREILGLMAQGMSNSMISESLVVSSKTVESHIAAIFAKLDLPPSPEGHRRVLAVLEYLRS